MNDYRKKLRAAGIDTNGMRPMGSAEAQMRVMARRTKRRGYSWSEKGVQVMLRLVMARKEGRLLMDTSWQTTQTEKPAMMSLRKILKQVTQQSIGCVKGMIRLLQGAAQATPLGDALKGLSGR